MIIPHDQLKPETLRALIEEFVTRQGAVHGHDDDAPIDRKVADVVRLLERGKASIVFDEEDESCSIMTVNELKANPLQEPGSRERRIEYDDD